MAVSGTRLSLFGALLVAAILGGIVMPFGAGAVAADAKPVDTQPFETKPWRYNDHSDTLPFPRGDRAQSVWSSGGCWSECGSYCAWGAADCLTRAPQGHCLKLTDACDRSCQRQCRSSGGPLLPLDFFWD
jgi:hypothetical protein